MPELNGNLAVFAPRSSTIWPTRVQPVVDRFGVVEYNSLEPVAFRRTETLLATRSVLTLAQRRQVRRLVYDPFDLWCAPGSPKESNPIAFWRAVLTATSPDEVLATSPHCAELMHEAYPAARVHLVPHHADPRVQPDWYDPAGPVVYCGLRCFLGDSLGVLEEACLRAKLTLRCDFGGRSPEALRGASLALCLRLPPSNTPLARECKPTIKIANALAAGIPVLATDDPAILSLHPELAECAYPASHFNDPALVAKLLLKARERHVTSRFEPISAFLDRMGALLNTEPVTATCSGR